MGIPMTVSDIFFHVGASKKVYFFPKGKLIYTHCLWLWFVNRSMEVFFFCNAIKIKVQYELNIKLSKWNMVTVVSTTIRLRNLCETERKSFIQELKTIDKHQILSYVIFIHTQMHTNTHSFLSLFLSFSRLFCFPVGWYVYSVYSL